MKVLLATDGSTCAREALAAAARLLPLDQLELVVASVAPMPSPLMMAPAATMDTTPAIAYEQLVELAKRQAHEALDATRALLGPAGGQARYVAREGDPARQLLDVAAEEAPDLVVMGSHGRGFVGRALLGSVSEAVLHRWAGPVMIIREGVACTPAPAPRTVQEVMSRVLVVAPVDLALQAAALMMAEADVGALPVVDAGRLVGIFTDRDLVVRAIASGADPVTATVGAFCTRTPATATPQMPLGQAVKLMEARKVRRLPVVDDGQLVGMVSLGDLAECAPLRAEEVLVEISKSPSTLSHAP
jgi:CBS domain-containing protein/nucleotide-binding universal stress UspA family protein